MKSYFILLLLSSILLSCKDSDTDNSQNDTQGDVRFELRFQPNWNEQAFPTQYPNNAHWSPMVGTVHNHSVEFWRLDNQLRTSKT